MNILLAACNAKYIHSNLAVHSLRAYAGEYSSQIQVKEYTINQPREEILGDLYESGPDVLCFSCYIWNISLVTELIADLRRILPRTPIWVGGPEVSYDAAQFLEEHPQVTGVMAGEGEETFRQLARYYLKGTGRLSEIAGLVYREEGIVENPPREPLDLSEIPFPYGELTDFEHRILYYESSRGCPFSCSYCLSSVDKRLRFRALSLVKKELAFFLERRVPQVKFVDRTFNCRREHALAIWQFLLERDNGVTNFHFEVSADLLDEEALGLLARMRPGLIQLEIGVQSTNRETLLAIRRPMDFAKVAEAVRRIRAAGNIHQHLDLIAGLPGEDFESFHRSFNDVYALRPHQLQLGFLKVLKGSPLWRKAQEYGCCYGNKEPYEVLFTRWLSFGEIRRLKRVETMVEVYYNSGQFQKTLAFLEPRFPDPFCFYWELGRFYQEKGYEALSHSRLRRYEILLEFLENVKGVELEEAKEAMLWDLYLREPLKRRPGWAPDISRWERKIREYLRLHKQGQAAHIEIFGGRAHLFTYECRDPLTHDGRVEEIAL